jgi:hypothetical protein
MVAQTHACTTVANSHARHATGMTRARPPHKAARAAAAARTSGVAARAAAGWAVARCVCAAAARDPAACGAAACERARCQRLRRQVHAHQLGCCCSKHAVAVGVWGCCQQRQPLEQLAIRAATSVGCACGCNGSSGFTTTQRNGQLWHHSKRIAFVWAFQSEQEVACSAVKRAVQPAIECRPHGWLFGAGAGPLLAWNRLQRTHAEVQIDGDAKALRLLRIHTRLHPALRTCNPW